MNTPIPETQALSNNLVRLARDFKSQEPAQVTDLKRAFKNQSKNDLVRTVVYLMEVVGVSDMRIKTNMAENKDLREILKLNNINLDEDDKEKKDEEAPQAPAQEATEAPAQEATVTP